MTDRQRRPDHTLKDPEIEVALGAAIDAIRHDNTEAGMLALKTILELSPQHELANGMLASLYAQLGMPYAAINYYHTTLEINPDNHLARFQLGIQQLETGQAKVALQTWEPLLGLEGQFMPQFYSAIALIALERPQEANKLLTQAQATMPQDHPLRAHLAEQLEKTRSGHD